MVFRIYWYFLPTHDGFDAFLTQIRQNPDLHPSQLGVATENARS